LGAVVEAAVVFDAALSFELPDTESELHAVKYNVAIGRTARPKTMRRVRCPSMFRTSSFRMRRMIPTS
jgi:hypothetical protein